jgi:hypothetical protein
MRPNSLPSGSLTAAHARGSSWQQGLQGIFEARQGSDHEMIVTIGHRGQPVDSGHGQNRPNHRPVSGDGAGEEPGEDPGLGEIGTTDPEDNARIDDARARGDNWELSLFVGAAEGSLYFSRQSSRTRSGDTPTNETREAGREGSYAVAADLEADLTHIEVHGEERLLGTL